MNSEAVWLLVARGVIAGSVIVMVSEIGTRFPRAGALVLTLPLISILAFVITWTQQSDLVGISRLARETLVLVPLGLPFFVPLAFADRWGLDFWAAFVAGVALASVTIALWFLLGPKL